MPIEQFVWRCSNKAFFSILILFLSVSLSLQGVGAEGLAKEPEMPVLPAVKRIPGDSELFCGTMYRELRQVWEEAPVEARRIVTRLKNPKLRGPNYVPYAFFYGEPGAGKTVLAKAVAMQAGYVCDFIGMGEIQAASGTKNQRNQTGINLLKRLGAVVALSCPTVVILDEINEYLEGFENEGNDTSFTSKTLWDFLDSQIHNHQFFLIGTMNRGDRLPKPMKSRGEACAVKVLMSSDPERRVAIFKNIMCDDGVKMHTDCDDEFLKKLIGVTLEYQARDFKNIANEAHGLWIDETGGEGEQAIRKKHITAAMCKIETVRSDWKHNKRIVPESEQNRINFLKGQAIYLACQARQKMQKSVNAQGGILVASGGTSITSSGGIQEECILSILQSMFTKEDIQDLKEEYDREAVIPFRKIKAATVL